MNDNHFQSGILGGGIGFKRDLTSRVAQRFHIQQTLTTAEFVDGKTTAGWYAKQLKHNQQLKPGVDQPLAAMVKTASNRHPLFQVAVRYLSRKIFCFRLTLTVFQTSAVKRVGKFVFHRCLFFAQEQLPTRKRDVIERMVDQAGSQAGVGSVGHLLPPKQRLPSSPVDSEPPKQTSLGLPLYPVMPRKKLIS